MDQNDERDYQEEQAVGHLLHDFDGCVVCGANRVLDGAGLCHECWQDELDAEAESDLSQRGYLPQEL